MACTRSSSLAAAGAAKPIDSPSQPRPHTSPGTEVSDPLWPSRSEDRLEVEPDRVLVAELVAGTMHNLPNTPRGMDNMLRS